MTTWSQILSYLGWVIAAYSIWQSYRMRCSYQAQLQDLKKRTENLCCNYEDNLDALLDRCHEYEGAYDHMRYCRQLLNAGPDEVLADAIERATGIRQPE